MAIVSNRVAFWDGDNFIIVNKKCDKEVAKKIMQALAAVDLDEGSPAPDATVRPIKEPEEVMPAIPTDDVPAAAAEKPTTFPPGNRYGDKTPQQIIDEEGDKAYANFAYFIANNKYMALADDMRAAMQGYLQKRFAKHKDDPAGFASELKPSQVAYFFSHFGSLASEEDRKAVCSQAGMIDFEAFLKSATLEQKQSLICALIEKYVK